MRVVIVALQTEWSARVSSNGCGRSGGEHADFAPLDRKIRSSFAKHTLVDVRMCVCLCVAVIK